MVTISKRIFYTAIGIIAFGSAVVATQGFPPAIARILSPVTLVVVLLVPGLLGYLGLTRSAEIDQRVLIYAVGLSATILMFFGFFVNLVHQIGGGTPLRPVTVWLSYALLLGGLGWGVERRVPDAEFEFVIPTTLRPYLYTTIPITAMVGALLMDRGGSNWISLSVLVLVFVFFAVGAFRPAGRGVLLYCLSLGLLLQNTFASQYLFWRDQVKEANLVYHILHSGYWNPFALPHANKATMLAIVILHPLHVLLTGVDIRFAFKFVYPVIFALTPVVMYWTFAHRNRPRAGYFAAGAFMFSFPFITVLSRNTRTGMAILFIALFLRVLLDVEVPPRARRYLLSVFGISVFVSHYGTGYMFFVMLVGGFVIANLARPILRRSRADTETLPVLSVVIVALLATAWYIYISPHSASFGTFVGFLVSFTEKLQHGFFQPSHSATAHYATESLSSISLTGTKLLTFVLFGVIGLGWLVAFARAIRGREGVEVNLTYLAVTALGGALISVTFLPVAKFNTARTLMISLVVVAPLFFIGVDGLRRAIDGRVHVPRSVPVLVCLGLLLPYFVFASGLLAATVTHDYSPNELAYRSGVIHHGSPKATSYLFKQYQPRTGTTASQWLQRYASGDVYGSGWPGNPDPGSMAARETPSRYGYSYHGNVSAATSGSCLYLGPMSVRAGVISLPARHLSSAFSRTSQLNTADKSKVYANSGARLYC